MISCRPKSAFPRITVFAVVIAFTGQIAWAAPAAQQQGQPPPTQTQQGPPAAAPQQPAPADQTPTPEIVVIKTPGFFEWKFSSVVGLVAASTIFNIHTTFEVRKRCPACEETSPLLQPIIKAGKPATYAVFGALESLAMWASYKSRKHGQWHWWIAPLVITGMHVVAGVQNRRLIKKLDAGR